jgi:L-ascorbate metabolism protein UlaG (beta-lactamase superfamily)
MPPPPERVDGDRLLVTFINHSTVLMQTGGLNILTDPIWSMRASPVSWSGPKRHTAPGVRLDDLPPIDIVLLSHNHYDHCDIPTLRRLAVRYSPRIITSLGNTALLESKGIGRGVDLDWWQDADLSDALRVTAVPAEHFSGRGLGDRNRTLWCGFVIEGSGGPIYFAGDTGYGPQFDEIASRFAPPRLALLPIGAYLPRWFMSPVHMGPDEAVRAHQALKASASLGIHIGTFALADDGEDEPVEELKEELKKAGIPGDRFRALKPGESWEVGVGG